MGAVEVPQRGVIATPAMAGQARTQACGKNTREALP